MLKIKKFLLERKKVVTFIAVSLILLFMFFMALFSSRGAFGDPGDSAIVDEIAHIPAGYTYDKDLDYRLNPEHPPLAKALAGFPLLLDKNIKGPEGNWSWNGINQWESGWYMLYDAGNDPKHILDLARLPMILLMIGLGLFLFKWATELYGRKVGLVVLALYAFYPDVLAHGRLVTTDIAAAFGFVIATYFFNKALQKRTWNWTIVAAIAFGVAQLLKFSAFLLFFVFLILAIIKAVSDKKKGTFWAEFWKNFKTYFWVCSLSVIVVWLVYLPFVFKTPAEIEHKLIEMNLTNDPRTLSLRNFLHFFEGNPVLRALGHYILGIFLVIGRVGGGNKTFILGHLSDKSISWYFPVAWLLKTPITIILLALGSLVSVIAKWPKPKEKQWVLWLILVPIIIYWGFTLKGQLNIGIRHLMPTVPFVLLLIGYFIHPIINGGKIWQKLVLGILVVYMIASTLINYPNFISYFNEATPKDQRFERLIDSSLDWGQDLLRLKKYVDDNNIKDIKVDYFGGGVPSYYMSEAKEWHSAYGPTFGWIAVSATFYQSSKLVGREEGQWSYDWLDNYKPVTIIGGSILVFNIDQAELQKNFPESPYPLKQAEMPTPVGLRQVGI